MKELYYANKEYNRKKRRNSIIMSVLLVLLSLGLASVFLVNKDYLFAGIFGVLALLPIFTIPAAFKAHPVKDDPIVKITDKDVTVLGKTAKYKDIVMIKAIIELPVSRLDSENKKLLEEMKDAKPENVFFGNFDVVVRNPDGKKETYFSHIDCVVEAIETLVYYGFKDYQLSYSIKKQNVVSTYDFWKDSLKRKEEEQSKQPKSKKHKQLI